jgi:hypothetical protein
MLIKTKTYKDHPSFHPLAVSYTGICYFRSFSMYTSLFFQKRDHIVHTRICVLFVSLCIANYPSSYWLNTTNIYTWSLLFIIVHIYTFTPHPLNFVTPKWILTALSQSFMDTHKAVKILSCSPHIFAAEEEQGDTLPFCLGVPTIDKHPFCSLFSATFFHIFVLFVGNSTV